MQVLQDGWIAVVCLPTYLVAGVEEEPQEADLEHHLHEAVPRPAVDQVHVVVQERDDRLEGLGGAAAGDFLAVAPQRRPQQLLELADERVHLTLGEGQHPDLDLDVPELRKLPGRRLVHPAGEHLQHERRRGRGPAVSHSFRPSIRPSIIHSFIHSFIQSVGRP